MCHLVVRLSEVVQAWDVFQKHSELRRQVFEHQAMVVSLLQLPHVFLGTKNTNLSHVNIYKLPGQGSQDNHRSLLCPWSSSTVTDRPGTPPACRRETTGHHDDPSPAGSLQSERHLSSSTKQTKLCVAEKPHRWAPAPGRQILTLFLWALTDA